MSKSSAADLRSEQFQTGGDVITVVEKETLSAAFIELNVSDCRVRLDEMWR